MPSSINQVISARKKDLRVLAANLKEIDTVVEFSQRRLARLLQLKRKVPERQDLIDLFDESVTSMNDSVDKFINVFGTIISQWGG